VAERLAHLAARLTPRDLWLCELLDEHRVLTTHQLTDLAFPNLDTAEHRLVILHRLQVLERFRPRRDSGTAPYHYVLGPAGARVLAARRGQDPSGVRYRRDDALAVAHWQHLEHLVAVNGFFCALARAARGRADRALAAWWSERHCAARWGRLVRPDGYGRWRDGQAEVDFFVEVDRGSEAPTRLAGKLEGYATLAAVTQVPTPVLFWFPSTQREATARATLAAAAAVPLPVATAATTATTATTASGGRGAHNSPDPAGPVWLPIGSAGPRQPLAALATNPRDPPPAPPPRRPNPTRMAAVTCCPDRSCSEPTDAQPSHHGGDAHAP
jgi:Replication-relaxation